MTDLFVALGGLSVLAAAGVYFEQLERAAREKADISSLASARLRVNVQDRWLRWGSLAVCAAALAGFLMAGAGHIAAVVVLALALVARHGLNRLVRQDAIAQSRLLLLRAMEAPEIRKAEMAFHFSAVNDLSPWHVEMWKESINRIGRPWYVILREAHHLSFFRAEGMPTAVLAAGRDDLKYLVGPRVKLVFYANNAQRNRAMLAAHPGVSHVQLLHGDSDKSPSHSPLTQNFDLVFVAGQMAIDRYALHGVDIPAKKFRIVGRPQLSAMAPRRERHLGDPLIVGYMPTWRGFYEDTQFSSLNRAAEIIARLRKALPGAEIVFKPHPLSYKDPRWDEFQAAICSVLGPKDRFADVRSEPFDIYNAVDLLITDISSVMIDFLYSCKPFLVIQPAYFDAKDAWRYPSLAGSYQVTPELTNLEPMLAAALGEDPLKDQRARVRESAFGDLDRAPGDAFVETCRMLLEEGEADGRRG